MGRNRIKFVFYERDDNLSFCAILHVFALAFADSAFESEWINCPDDLSTFSVPSHLMAVQLHFHEHMQEIPLCRRAVRLDGQLVTSPTKALQYTTIHHQNVRLGEEAGFKDRFTFYNGRRGGGEGINGA